MKAVWFNKPWDLDVRDVADPVIQSPTDAIIRTVATCVCGSDLWSLRGENTREHGTPIGHEFVGEVLEAGSDVRNVAVGDFVVVPFDLSCGRCPHCRNGALGSCTNGTLLGQPAIGGAQAELCRVTYADHNLVVVPGGRPSDSLLPDLLALTDVMATGYYCAVSAGVKQGDTAAVIGDGAVGLSAVIAAKMLGAEHIVAFSRNPERQALAREFGATHIIESRGDEAVEELLELTNGVGADAALECVGLGLAMETAFAVARPGSTVGYVGVPHGTAFPTERMFRKNINVAGGIAPSLTYTPLLMRAVLDGQINPGKYFDLKLPFEDIVDGYTAMNERTAIKAWSQLA